MPTGTQQKNGQNVINYNDCDHTQLTEYDREIERRISLLENQNSSSESPDEFEITAYDLTPIESIATERLEGFRRSKLPPWRIRNIHFPGTIIDYYPSGEWSVICPCKNVSGSSNWNVYHRLICFSRRTKDVIFTVETWNGRFGAGYEETKKANGHSDKIHQYWKELENRTFYLSQGATIIKIPHRPF